MDDARSEALETLTPFIKKVSSGGYDLPLIGHFGGDTKLTFSRAGVAAPKAAPKAEAPTDPNAGAKPPQPGAVRAFQDGKWGWLIPN